MRLGKEIWVDETQEVRELVLVPVVRRRGEKEHVVRLGC